MATTPNSWHRNTITSLAHPPRCPLFPLTVNKAECGSGESAEPHKGYYLSLSCLPYGGHISKRITNIVCSYWEQVALVFIAHITLCCLTHITLYNPCLLTWYLATSLENSPATSCQITLLYSCWISIVWFGGYWERSCDYLLFTDQKLSPPRALSIL